MNSKMAFAFGADVLVVLAFAATGRSTHDTGDSLTGTLATAAPFLVGLVIGWAAILAVRLRSSKDSSKLKASFANPLSLLAGVTIWTTTVFLGLGLRVLLGGTAAGTFVLVAMAVLGAGLLGWRLVVLLLSRILSRNTQGTAVQAETTKTSQLSE